MTTNCVLLAATIILPAYCAARLRSEDALVPLKPKPTSILSAEITELPGTVHLKLGQLPAGVTTIKTVSLLNRTSETIVVRSSKSDCGCMVGIVPDNPVAPGEKLLVQLKLKPALQSRIFRRKLLLLQEEGSNRVIEILVGAESIPILTASKRNLQFDLGSKVDDEEVEVLFRLSFDRQFDEPNIIASEGARLRWTRKSWSKSEAVFAAVPSASEQWRTGLTLLEPIRMRVNDKVSAEVAFTLVARDVYQVRPTKFRLNGPDENEPIRFFVVGEFPTNAEGELGVGISVVTPDGDTYACTVRLKAGRVAVCSFNSARIRDVGVGKEVEVVLVMPGVGINKKIGAISLLR